MFLFGFALSTYIITIIYGMGQVPELVELLFMNQLGTTNNNKTRQ